MLQESNKEEKRKGRNTQTNSSFQKPAVEVFPRKSSKSVIKLPSYVLREAEASIRY